MGNAVAWGFLGVRRGSVWVLTKRDGGQSITESSGLRKGGCQVEERFCCGGIYQR